MEAIRDGLYEILLAGYPMSVRQVFYAATTRGLIAKAEAEYKTVVRLLGEMRRDGTIPYGWLADATRWMRRPRTYSSAESALKRTAATYRQALWDESDVVVEVWLEKEALAGVLVEVTNKWDVPLMVTRGYPSMSFLYSAAEAILDRADGKRRQRTALYYFGDRDPSGLDIDRAVREGIGEAIWSMLDEDDREPTAEDEFRYWADFERIAVTEDQIVDWDLPTRPTKTTDSRAQAFDGTVSVELDAIPVDLLRGLAQECIERHVDDQQLAALLAVEAEERRVLMQIAETMNGGAP